jgi:glycine/D-amino acid oxidase-like deaminating enzyme
LGVVASVMRTERLDGGPEISAAGGRFGYRKRMDGGYTVSTVGARLVDIVPDSFRLFRHYLPAMRVHWKKLRFRLGRRFIDQWQTPRRWQLDARSPFEDQRVLDPAPDPFLLERARAGITEAFPAFRTVPVAESWAGMIDVTPDAIPIISAVDKVAGFYIATGFSGHGFGIGPGAGRLMADMVMGRPPLVDPTPFRLGRFTDGSNPEPDPLAS